jgi:hypothetical protein
MAQPNNSKKGLAEIFNTAANGLLLMLAGTIFLKVHEISVEQGKITVKIEEIERRFADNTTYVNRLQQDIREATGAMNQHEIRLTKIEAALPNKNQFKIKNY